MSAYHEYQHLTDYCRFLNTVFSGCVEELKQSSLYATFNVYSEFSATRAGIIKYGNTVKFIDSSIEDRCMALLETYLDMYKKGLTKVFNPYQRLITTVQYYGCISAIPVICQDVDISVFVHEIQFLDELSLILQSLSSFEDTAMWYKQFDTITRKFIG